MDARQCPKCRTVFYEEEVRFCYEDGSILEPRLIHECGRHLHPADKFCPKCGKDLTGVREKNDVIPV